MDQSVYEWMAGVRIPFWLQFNRALTFLGQAELIFFLAAGVMIYLMLKKWIREGIWYFVSLVLGMELNFALKVYFERARPAGFGLSTILKSYAYPSGHTFGATIFYVITWLFLARVHPGLWNKKYLTFMFMGFIPLVVGTTRVTLGVHWVTDVIAGFLLGITWIFLNLTIAKKYDFFKKPTP